jgi:hypothetical protein
VDRRGVHLARHRHAHEDADQRSTRLVSVTSRHSARSLLLVSMTLAVFLTGCGSGSSATSAGTISRSDVGVSVAARGSEATAATAHCRVDSGPWIACGSPFTAFDLVPGQHVIDVEATHGGVSVLRRPPPSTGDRVAVVSFANSSRGPSRASVDFTVAGSPQAGSLVVTGIARGGSVHGLLPLRAHVPGGGSRTVLVDFYVDGRIVATAASAPWDALVDSTRVSPGPHTVRAVAISLDRRRRASPAVPVRVARSHIIVPQDAVRGALQAAVDLLGPDGGTLRLPAGRFPVSDLRIGGGVRLIGAGVGRTVLVGPDGGADAVEVTGEHVLISDLTIDARGTGSAPEESAAILVRNAEDVVLRRLSLAHLRGYGVQVLGHHRRISLQASQIDGDGRGLIGLAEWADDATSGDISMVRCVVRNLQKYGALLQSYFGGRTWPHPRALAYGNAISNIHDPTVHDGTIEIGIWIAGVAGAALDNVVRDTGWDGIETVVNATRPTISGNVVRDTMTGIYIENVTRGAVIEQNDIADVDAGINLEPPHGGPASGQLRIRYNRIVGARDVGIALGPGTLGSTVTGNQVLDSGTMAVVLQGATGNTVEGNDLRDRRNPARQQWCVYDPLGRGATSTNQVSGNDCTGSRNGGSNDLARFSARRGAIP